MVYTQKCETSPPSYWKELKDGYRDCEKWTNDI